MRYNHGSTVDQLLDQEVAGSNPTGSVSYLEQDLMSFAKILIQKHRLKQTVSFFQHLQVNIFIIASRKYGLNNCLTRNVTGGPEDGPNECNPT